MNLKIEDLERNDTSKQTPGEKKKGSGNQDLDDRNVDFSLAS